MKASLSAALILAAVVLGGCTVHQTPAPGLSGPSELSLSVKVAALPDSISQDGGSQSQIQVSAFGPDGKAKIGLALRVDMFVTDATGHLVGADYGTLSARTVVTTSTGVAMVVYTAPPSPVGGLFGTCEGLPGNCVVIVATPIGTDLEAAAPQSATIRLVPPGVILPPAQSPTALFSFSPSTPAANSPVAFDGSASCAGFGSATNGCSASNNVITSYSWNFGDGQSGSGPTVSHNYSTAGTYNATLTVTNDRGLTGSATKAINVGAGSGPTAAFVYSPTPVLTGIETFFDASASTPSAGHRIVTYAWNFGDGDPIKSGSTPTTQHDFGNVGAYVVVLTVTDESGQTNTTSQSISVTAPAGGAAGAPTANFTSSPTLPVVNEAVVFDSSSSTVATGRTITDYAWNFGDDTPIVHGNSRIISHTYSRPGTFVVNLVLTDNTGATGQKSSSVPVGTGNPVATLSVFKTGGNSVQGDGSASTASGTSTISTYTFFWGDGTSTSGGASSAAHNYGVAGTYTVTLRVTDSLGRTGTSTAVSITVP